MKRSTSDRVSKNPEDQSIYCCVSDNCANLIGSLPVLSSLY